MVSKSRHAFRTISEASEELGLKPHVLRFWEVKFPEINPTTRAGGRRYYRTEDVDLLRGLKILLHEERMKIKDVQKILKRKGAAEVIKLGASSINRLPPKPVSERNLVPEHITPSVPRPEDNEDISLEDAPAEATAETPVDDVPYSAARPAEVVADPEPIEISTASEPAAAEPETPSLSEEKTEELESALDRLSALRSRWKKFAD